MLYSDLIALDSPADRLAEYIDENPNRAFARIQAAYKRGIASEPIAPGIDADDDYQVRKQFARYEEQSDTPGILTDLAFDAWHTGIVERKLTVRLDSGVDGTCECGRTVASYDDSCEQCGSTTIDRQVLVTVDAPYAGIWADWDRSIDGSSWETPSDMPHTAYAIISDRPTLVEDLRKEGYTLDLTDYQI